MFPISRDASQLQCYVPAPVLYPSSARASSKSLCRKESKHQASTILSWCPSSYFCVQTDKIPYPTHGRSCGERPGPWTKGGDFQLSHKSSLWLLLVFVLSPYITVCLHSLWLQLFAQILIPCFHNDTEAAVYPLNYDFSVGDYCFSFLER